MKNLWAPWRMQYILAPKVHNVNNCVLCAPDNPDEDLKSLIVYRGKLTYVMLNRFPYASGHLMVLPYRHLSDIVELTPEESSDLMESVKLSCRALRECSHAPAFNVGLNLGEAAGAGIAMHLHMHVVPRWNGDVNFMTILDDIRVVPEALDETRNRLAAIFARLV